MTALQGSEHRLNWKARFFTIWTGQQLSLLGSHLAGFALIWWLTESTGSATVLAMAAVGRMSPAVMSLGDERRAAEVTRAPPAPAA